MAEFDWNVARFILTERTSIFMGHKNAFPLRGHDKRDLLMLPRKENSQLRKVGECSIAQNIQKGSFYNKIEFYVFFNFLSVLVSMCEG